MTEAREQACQESLQILDAYLDNNLAEDSKGALLKHIALCSACAKELDDRRNMRIRLRTAVRSVPAPDFLATRVRANVRASGSHAGWRSALAAALAATVICVSGAIAYQLGHLRLTVQSQEAYNTSVSNRVPTLMRVGLGDHIHCSVFRKYASNAQSLEEFTTKMGPEYSGILPIVRSRVPSGFQVMLAHLCRYHSRRFVHLALKNESALLSVVITRKGGGESFATEELLPALSESGIPIYRSGVQRFQMAAFESNEHLVYVISDLPQQQNMQLMRAMAPELKQFLAKLEG